MSAARAGRPRARRASPMDDDAENTHAQVGQEPRARCRPPRHARCWKQLSTSRGRLRLALDRRASLRHLQQDVTVLSAAPTFERARSKWWPSIGASAAGTRRGAIGTALAERGRRDASSSPSPGSAVHQSSAGPSCGRSARRRRPSTVSRRWAASPPKIDRRRERSVLIRQRRRFGHARGHAFDDACHGPCFRARAAPCPVACAEHSTGHRIVPQLIRRSRSRSD